MEDILLDRSTRFIDEGVFEGPQANNPTDASFHEITSAIGVVCAFSHVWSLRTDAGLVVFDTSLAPFGPLAVDAIRRWTGDPFDTIVYTHGHADHVGGVGAFLADAEGRGDPRPPIVSHENAPSRFDRYELTHGYNAVINGRQFGPGGLQFPDEFVRPDRTFTTELPMEVGDTEIVLHHDRGETDDHAWAWVPEHRAVFTGDLFIWVLPNAGNPQKVQRYAADWAVALRKMIELGPELLLPAHGLPIAGSARIAGVLDATASTLEHLVGETLAMMNAGATLDEIVHTVGVPAEYADLPYLRPVYDESEFVVRNIWRLYGGWYDGNPAHLKPPREADLAAEVASLAGGAEVLAERAREVAAVGDLRLASQLVEWAATADGSPGVHAAREEIYRRRRSEELSLMSKGIFGSTADASAAEAAAGG